MEPGTSLGVLLLSGIEPQLFSIGQLPAELSGLTTNGTSCSVTPSGAFFGSSVRRMVGSEFRRCKTLISGYLVDACVVKLTHLIMCVYYVLLP